MGACNGGSTLAAVQFRYTGLVSDKKERAVNLICPKVYLKPTVLHIYSRTFATRATLFQGFLVIFFESR
jgi:hypothetical protein